eukprot:COSAG05_NODE_9209_length_639_cov_2.570370_1_plen_65_part_10
METIEQEKKYQMSLSEKEVGLIEDILHWHADYMCRQNMSQGITLPLRVPTKDNDSDCGTKCQSAP